MMLASLLKEERVFLGLKSKNCSEVMEEILDVLTMQQALDETAREQALAALQCREQQVSTGVGCGVGLPHAYLDDLDETLAVFGRSDEGIEFDSCDQAPVKFVILLLIPESQKGKHLQTLADIGRRFLKCNVREQLASATSNREVIEILEAE